MFVSSWWFRTKKTSAWTRTSLCGAVSRSAGPPSSLLRLPETVGQTMRRSVVTGSTESAGTVPSQTHQDASEKEEMLLWVNVQWG